MTDAACHPWFKQDINVKVEFEMEDIVEAETYSKLNLDLKVTQS